MKKNFIFITLDSLRYDFFEEVGRDYLPGFTVFADAYAQGPFTPISIPSFMTGIYPSRLDYIFYEDASIAILNKEVTISRVLKQSGYATAAFHSNPFFSRRFGYATGHDLFVDTYGGADNKFLSARVSRFLRYARRMLKPYPYLPASELNRLVSRFLETVKEPFFLWIHYMDTHGPYLRHDRNIFWQKIPAEKRWRKCSYRPERATAKDHGILLDAYKSEIRYTLEHVGVLFAELKNRGLSGRTYIVFTSDHGDELGEHGYYSHPRRLFETLIHVPLLIAGPDIPAEKVVSRVVELTSIFPTLCELAGVKDDFDIDGVSLVPLLSGREDGYGNDYAISEASFSREPKRKSIRRGKWKYICEDAYDYPRNQPPIALDKSYSPHNGEYLFDLERDSREKMNIAMDHPDKCSELKEVIERVLSREPGKLRETGLEGPGDDGQILKRLEALGYL